jgi:MoaA/NifB/PqqE/SkfB family radical SAM enzyme
MSAPSTPEFLWLEITGRCQLECVHCYADSSPAGTHGSMTAADWKRVIDQGAALGVRAVQFIGGEPTLHPDLPELVGHALGRALAVEVFTNLVKISTRLWEVFAQPGVTLATSYYSDDAGAHAAITGRPTHRRTTANIATARRLGIPLRAGVVDLVAGQRTAQAGALLAELGVPRIGYDRLRQVGRGERTAAAAAPALCGQCGDGVAAVGPDGTVTPCVFARWQGIGNVREESLAVLGGALPAARAALVAQGMRADLGPADPECNPKSNCWPYNCHPRG